MNILRVENAEGVGPYQPEQLADISQRILAEDLVLAHSPTDSKSHPLPDSDGIRTSVLPDDYRCGFTSPEAAYAWFEDFIDYLTQVGFCLCIYQVPDEHIVLGGRQCMFNSKYATLVGSTSPGYLLTVLFAQDDSLGGFWQEQKAWLDTLIAG